MTVRDVRLYLEDILESITLIIQYCGDLTKDEFEEEIEKQDSIIRRLEIIGEAARQIPDNLKMENPDIPWRDIGDFRNVLVHEYFGLKIDRVWRVIHKDLPKLKEQIEKLIQELG